MYRFSAGNLICDRFNDLKKTFVSSSVMPREIRQCGEMQLRVGDPREVDCPRCPTAAQLIISTHVTNCSM